MKFKMVFLVLAMVFIVGCGMGVMNPGAVLPEKCQFPTGLECLSAPSVVDDSFAISLKNLQGSAILLDHASTAECQGETMVSTDKNTFHLIDDQEIGNNDVFNIKFTGCTFPKKDQMAKYETSVIFINVETQVQNELKGEITIRG